MERKTTSGRTTAIGCGSSDGGFGVCTKQWSTWRLPFWTRKASYLLGTANFSRIVGENIKRWGKPHEFDSHPRLGLGLDFFWGGGEGSVSEPSGSGASDSLKIPFHSLTANNQELREKYLDQTKMWWKVGSNSKVNTKNWSILQKKQKPTLFLVF